MYVKCFFLQNFVFGNFFLAKKSPLLHKPKRGQGWRRKGGTGEEDGDITGCGSKEGGGGNRDIPGSGDDEDGRGGWVSGNGDIPGGRGEGGGGEEDVNPRGEHRGEVTADQPPHLHTKEDN